MPLTIKPPRPPSEQPSSSPPQRDTFTFSVPPPSSISFSSVQDAPSPVAPDYSPITPKVQPVLPASVSTYDGAPAVPPPDTNTQSATPSEQIASTVQYIPQPPPQPFSSEDSTDAIALRAAISALQFQKKKAQDDLRTLEVTRKHALDNPQEFKDALVAGRLKEHRPQYGGLQAILDQAESDSEEEDAMLGATVEDEAAKAEIGIPQPPARPAEVPDSQPSRPATANGQEHQVPKPSPPADFARIPGPQNVVRMPNVNWDKYHIVGEPLDRMHEQQRRWPGSFAYGQDRGREFAVAAPYSPFLDRLDGQSGQGVNGSRKDSGAPAHYASSTGTISEHPMETRRSSKNNQ
ncbi:hypothetical protein LTR36_008866 [Oleoguttula mirabilis]|uniref:Uncharacterized protein n=1 Tax=Oleoguttula mirabilis TaxID=1507867 RepID=A0AAV9J756_9PEZI|nr:hypothetical protein LTR36_008866 [Oleoguttula mirabilis]